MARTQGKPRRDKARGSGSGQAQAVAILNDNQAAATDEVIKGGAALKQTLASKQGLGQSQQAGHAAEHLVSTKFNEQAALAGSPARGYVPADNGPADVLLSGGVQSGQAQVKFHTNAGKTASAISDPKYDGMQKVVPSDQAAEVRAVASQRDVAGEANTRNYADTADRTSGDINYDGVKGGATTKREAIRAAKRPELVATEMSLKAGVREIGKSTTAGAVVGGLIAGGVAVVSNSIAVAQGEKDAKDAVVDTACEAGKGAARGAAVAATGSAIRIAAASTGLKVLARGNVALAAGALVVESGLTWADYSRGKITIGQAMERQTGAVGSGAGALAGAAAGTALIPIPVFGSVVGAIAGGLLGGEVFSSIGKWLFG